MKIDQEVPDRPSHAAYSKLESKDMHDSFGMSPTIPFQGFLAPRAKNWQTHFGFKWGKRPNSGYSGDAAAGGQRSDRQGEEEGRDYYGPMEQLHLAAGQGMATLFPPDMRTGNNLLRKRLTNLGALSRIAGRRPTPPVTVQSLEKSKPHAFK